VFQQIKRIAYTPQYPTITAKALELANTFTEIINANMAIIINLYSVISTSFALQRNNDPSRQSRDRSVSPWIDQIKIKREKGLSPLGLIIILFAAVDEISRFDG
jgi:hypothetical protein